MAKPKKKFFLLRLKIGRIKTGDLGFAFRWLKVVAYGLWRVENEKIYNLTLRGTSKLFRSYSERTRHDFGRGHPTVKT